MEQESIKTESKIPRVRQIEKIFPALPVIGVIIALAVSSGLVLSFDNDIGHFEFGSTSFYITAVGIIVATVLSAVLAVRSLNSFSLTAFPTGEPLSSCAAYFAALMAIIETAADLYGAIFLDAPIDGTLELLSVILLPAVSISLILGTLEKTRSSCAKIIFALVGSLSIISDMFARYFDFTLPLNSPIRNLITIAEAGILLFLFSEIRLAISHKERATAPFFVFSTAFASSAVLGISFGLCVYAFSSPYAAEAGISVYRFAFCFGTAILASSRLRSLGRCAGNYVTPAGSENTDEKTKNTVS